LSISGEINDISFLSGLTDLEKFSINNGEYKILYYGLDDYSPISDLENLQYLEIYQYVMEDTGFLSGLESLKTLSLGRTEVSDISFLSNF